MGYLQIAIISCANKIKSTLFPDECLVQHALEAPYSIIWFQNKDSRT